MNLIRNFLFASLFLFVAASVALAQNGTVRGTVTSSANNAAMPGVSVQISQLRRSAETNDQGIYEFSNVPPGRYTIVTHFEGFSDQAVTVVVTAGATTADFSLSLNSLREQVTVTASGTEESVFESFQTVNSIGSTQLREQASTGIGEVLERESGVGKRSFGPGTSRPVIRGFDGDRVLILQDGIRNSSLASQSGDHGEPIDTLGLERVEVIKGPATLLYGSNAIGGVVNTISTDEDDPHAGFRGYFTGLGATNNRQGGASGGLEYGYKKFVFTGNGNILREGDYETPFGRIPNSASRSRGGGGSVGYFGEKGFVVGSFSLDRRRYGTPYAPLFENGSLLTDQNGNPCKPDQEGEGGTCEYNIFAIRDRFSSSLPEPPDTQIDLAMQRNNYRLRGGFRDLKGFIPQGNFYVDFSRYRHQELEVAGGGDTIGTRFSNDTFSYRTLFQQAVRGKLSGRFGFEGYKRSYLTEGAEQLIAGRVHQNNFSVFTLEEIDFGRVALQFGGRVESNHYDPTNDDLYLNRSFTGFSGAAGARFRLWKGGTFVTNFNSSYRSPALEELYNNGAHIGTVTFEVGDQTLGRERSNGIEFSLRQQLKRFRFNGSIFYYNIDNFIFIAPRDSNNDGLVDVEDNLPVGNYRQDDARFVGADLSMDVDINKYVAAFFVADIVKAKLRDGDVPLPRITPGRARVGLDFRYKGLSVRPEALFVTDKKLDDVFVLETPTAGYSLFNLNASYTISNDHTAHIFSVGSTNLSDRTYRNALSFIKDLAPEQGRNLRFSYTFRFF
ncbi:MAG TPA: TonB-dependent receptor [Pyrinomonadaceae bacterium]|nr:TonB-dependent receptor [Pyrinomonadaceae bacterium]